MKELIRPALVICIVLLVPIIPFLAFGAKMHDAVDAWRAAEYSGPVTAAVIIGLLAGDIFLPTPSSVLSTLAGWQFGAVGGTIVSWIGMNAGAAIGFALARRYGRSVAERFSSSAQLERMDAVTQRYGPSALVVMRGVPVLAEASVLLVGINRLAWRRFLPPVLLSNLGLSLAYSVFGKQAEAHGMLPLAMGIAIGLPVLLGAIVSRWMRAAPKDTPNAADNADQDDVASAE